MGYLTGLALAVTLITGVWSGHILVRRLEYAVVDLRLPVWMCFLAGIVLAGLSLFSRSNVLSGVLGILGVILFWNGIELRHQEKRVKIGHAPANPDNPRHQQILAEFPAATIVDPLGHDHSILAERKS